MDTVETRKPLRSYLTACRSMPERDRRNGRIATWILASWMIIYAVASRLLRGGMIPDGPLVYLAVLVPTCISVLALLAYGRWLRHVDELHQKIQFGALALGFGGGFVGTFALDLVKKTGASQPEVTDLFFIMVMFYLLGVFLGTRRYA